MGAQRRRAARVPARDPRRPHLPACRQRRAGGDQQAHRPHLLVRRLGSLSASTPAVVDDTVYVTLLARNDGAGASSRSTTPPARSAGRARCRAPASPRRWSTTGWSSSAPRAGSCTRSTPHGQPFGPIRRPARSRPARRCPRGALLRRLLRARPGDLRADRPAHLDRGSEGALLGSGTSTRPPPSIYGRIFLGNTDGRIYAYDASTGALDWAVQTGGYV